MHAIEPDEKDVCMCARDVPILFEKTGATR